MNVFVRGFWWSALLIFEIICNLLFILFSCNYKVVGPDKSIYLLIWEDELVKLHQLLRDIEDSILELWKSSVRFHSYEKIDAILLSNSKFLLFTFLSHDFSLSIDHSLSVKQSFEFQNLLEVGVMLILLIWVLLNDCIEIWLFLHQNWFCGSSGQGNLEHTVLNRVDKGLLRWHLLRRNHLAHSQQVWSAVLHLKHVFLWDNDIHCNV